MTNIFKDLSWISFFELLADLTLEGDESFFRRMRNLNINKNVFKQIICLASISDNTHW